MLLVSVFKCLQPVSVFYKMWAKCNFIFKMAQTGQVEPWTVEATPPQKSSEWHCWLTWESQIVCMMGSLSSKKYESSGGGKWNCPVLCGSRSLCLSRSLLSLGKSHNVSVRKMKGLGLMSFGTFSTPGFCEDRAWSGKGSWWILLVFSFFSFLKRFKS